MKKILSFPYRRTLASALCGVSLLGLAGCGNKSKEEEPKGAGQAAVEPLSAEPAAELDPSSFNAQRAQAFGFLSRMPASTEGALGLTNLSDLAGGLIGSTAFERVAAMIQESGGELDEQMVQMVKATLDQYAGKELFLIMSTGSADQFRRLLFVSNLLSVANMRNAGAAASAGDTAVPTSMLLEELRNGLKDPASDLSKAIEGFQIPPIMLGSKIADGGPELIAQLDAMTTELPPMVSTAKVDIGGHQFTTLKIHLQDVVNEGVVASLNEFLQDEAASQRVADILRKKTIEVAVGIVDSYLVVSLGPDHRHVQFASKPEESILAAKAFGFSDQFLSKKLLGYAYLSKAMLNDAAASGGIAQSAEAFAEGLSAAGEQMGAIGTLVKKMAGHAEKLAAREAQTYVGITFMDQGLRGESTGGFTSAAVDSKSKSLFANSAPDDAALVISSVSNPELRDDSVAMMETVFELVDAGIGVYAANTGDDQFGQMKELFGPDLEKIWGIMKGDFLDGLGSQSGLVVDLKGSMPKVPGVPNVILNEGKVPRIAIAMDVQDRAKLASAWEKFVPAVNEALTKIPGQEEGAEVQLPDVLSDSGGGLTSHYFPLPFLSNDFVPSLSLNEEMFFLSTSKTFAQGLAGADAGAGDIRGTYVKVNFAELSRYLGEWVNLVEQNADQLFPEGEAQPTIMQISAMKPVLEFTESLRKFELNRYQTDDGAMRSSWHLQLQDIGAAGE